MKRTVLLALVLLALGASGAQAHRLHKVHFRPSPHMRSQRVHIGAHLGSRGGISLWREGKEIDGPASVLEECNLQLLTRRLTFVLSVCSGRRNVYAHYESDSAFTLVYWFD